MALPWIRLDANIATHDKIVHLMLDPSPKKYQAAAQYMFSLAWSGGQGTDGEIPTGVLPFIHGSAPAARLLEKYHLWDVITTGWKIRNFDVRQEMAVVAELKRAAQKAGAIKGNCIKYHGKECGCWRDKLGEADVA